MNSNITSLKEFYNGKKVLITGHTGFKGSWLVQLLLMFGAKVSGYALEPEQSSLYSICGLERQVNSVIGDIRELDKLQKLFNDFGPDIVIHMAAQPLVRESYENPVYTYDVNVMGTVNVLECVRRSSTVRSFVNVTTDKVYKNKEWEWGYRENEELNGFDPYSNSKSCSELVTSSYKNSFFVDDSVAISTARAGNVIGGGDFAKDRIIPDCVRAASANKDIILRNPNSIRPYQHVLEPLYAYLLIAMKQYESSRYSGCYNIGPNEDGCFTTGDIAQLFCDKWNEALHTNIHCVSQNDYGPHEANYLKLDCSKFKVFFGWNPNWTMDYTMEKIVEWYVEYFQNGDINKCMIRQISEFIDGR